MKLYNKILAGAALLLAPFFSSCEEEMGKPVHAELQMQPEIVVEPEEGIHEVPLKSTYPWYAVANVDWIKVTKNRGQALLDEKIVFKVEPNTDLDPREARILVKLMDQLTAELIVRQNGQGEYVNLPSDKVYFNNQVSEYTMSVLTRVDWNLDKTSENGISFEKVDQTNLKIKAEANTTGSERSASVTLSSVKDPSKTATLTVYQKAEKDILSYVLTDKERQGVVAKKAGSQPATLTVVSNKKFTVTPSEDWIKVDKLPENQSVEIVQNLEFSYSVEANPSRQERTGYITIQAVGEDTKDVFTIYQRGVEDIVYCKAGGTGDGTSWDRAYGDIVEAMNACGHHASQELWVSEGEFEIFESLTKKYVNVYGGFKGDEIALAQRDASKKTVLKGKKKFLVGYRLPSEPAMEDYYMDGFEITGVNDPNGNVGMIEFYDHHVLRNCIVHDNTFGKNAGGYYENTKVINCVFYNNINTGSAGAIQLNNSDLVNCTIVNNQNTGAWGAGGGLRAAAGSRLINSVIWGNIAKTTGRAQNVQVYLDKSNDIEIVNCFIQMGLKKDGKTPVMFNDGNTPKGDKGYTEIAADNAKGARFVNPQGHDYRPGAGSVLINAGNKARLDGMGAEKDIVGEDRIKGDNPDVGAYEIQ